MARSSQGDSRDRQGRRFSILGSMGTGSTRGETRDGKNRVRKNHKNRKKGRRTVTKGPPVGEGGRHRPSGYSGPGNKDTGQKGVNPTGRSRGSSYAHSKEQPTGTPAGGLDAFELFSTYHLGIGKDGKYRPSNIHEVARRFKTTVGGIRELLSKYKMDSDSIINSDFDMAMAQYDIQVAPEGVDVRELAKNIYEDFMASTRNARDWHEELARDAEANARIFGKN
ncbi:MAG: hypothetical protein GXP49_04140 [Deltaproteobacteria bacterium]|nr:hypothetical protein [Deltaproteobacteria bacterium]